MLSAASVVFFFFFFLIGQHDCPSGDDSRRVADSAVSLGKTVDCIVISKGGREPHNYSIYYLSPKDSIHVASSSKIHKGNIPAMVQSKRDREGYLN